MCFHGLIAHFSLAFNIIQLSGCTVDYLLIHLQGHLGCFQDLTVMNKVAINNHMQGFV